MSAVGQPWLTGATCPGWPFPQLNAPPEHVRLRAAHGLHGVPEVGRGGLVGHVAQLAVQAAIGDLVEPLPGELEVVPLHVDGPALVALDVDPVGHAGDQLVGTRSVLGTAGARRWPSAGSACGQGSRRTRTRWSGRTRSAGRCGGRAGSRSARRPRSGPRPGPRPPRRRSPTVDRPCGTVRSPVTRIRGEPYCRLPSWSREANDVPA